MRRLLPLLALSAAIVSTAAAAEPRACPVGLHQATTVELYFGADILGPSRVSDADWRQFVDAEVTPRFPAGVAISDVYGQWQDENGRFVQDQSRALMLKLNGAPGERERLDQVSDAYKARFRQSPITLVEQQGCVAF